MSSYKKTQYYTKKKSKAKDGRENFLQLYDRTCHKIYFYAYSNCHNVNDADVIMRDAYIYMYEHIAELRNSKSVDIWQKECVEKAFRALLRSQRLELLDDNENFTASSTLSESKKEDLWNSIIKMADIDPWRMVPIPGKSSIFSVMADQTISDLRYMTIGDIIKSALTIIAICVAIVFAVSFIVNYIKDKQEGKVDAIQEIFLDERYYEGFDLTTAERVATSLVDNSTNDAMKHERDEEGNRLSYSYPPSIGNTAGSPVYTDDIDVNAALIDIIKEIITEDMSDFEKLEAIYEYVGTNLTYAEYTASGKDDVALIKDCLEHKSGTSQHYSALLAALCEAAGYRCTVIEGSFILNRDTEFERTVLHYWNRVSLNGIVYYLDVEADSSADGSTVRKYYFMAADGNPRWEIFNRDHIFS